MRPVPSRLRAALPGILIALVVCAWSLAWLFVPVTPYADAATFRITDPQVATVYIADGPTEPRAVALSDATVAPGFLRYLKPHQSITRVHQCGAHGYWTETSAYQWNGRALAGQRWNAAHDVTYWSASRGRVTFDGLTFHNGTHHPVIVTGWCV